MSSRREEEERGERREERGGRRVRGRKEGKREGGAQEKRWRRKFHSLVHSHQIRERGTCATSLFKRFSAPSFVSVPSPLAWGWRG